VGAGNYHSIGSPQFNMFAGAHEAGIVSGDDLLGLHAWGVGGGGGSRKRCRY